MTVLPLNQSSRADYYFGGSDDRTRQFCRVQVGELLGNIDSEEDELRRYYEQADENNQIIEGLISPIPLTRKSRDIEAISVRRAANPSVLFSYSVSEAGFIYNERAWDISASMLYAWVYRLGEAGINTYFTVNYVGTATFLSAVYKNCQQPVEKHTTLNRYYRPRIQIEKHNPLVQALVNLSSAYKLDIGEVKARSLAKRYKYLLDIAMADVNELCECEGIGKVIAKRLLESLGRSDC